MKFFAKLRRKRASRSNHKSTQDTAKRFPGGVFLQVVPSSYCSSSSSTSTTSSDADSTASSADSVSCTTTTLPSSWRSTETTDFYGNQPLFVSSDDDEVVLDEAAALGLAMQRSQKLPTTWYYSSNHVMVNMERRNRVVAPLTRLRVLDDLARTQAEKMARSLALFHSDPSVAQEALEGDESIQRRCVLGENVACGTSIREIHARMLQNPAQRFNLLHRRYTHFGMGTATVTATDGSQRLYLAQVFCG